MVERIKITRPLADSAGVSPFVGSRRTEARQGRMAGAADTPYVPPVLCARGRITQGLGYDPLLDKNLTGKACYHGRFLLPGCLFASAFIASTFTGYLRSKRMYRHLRKSGLVTKDGHIGMCDDGPSHLIVSAVTTNRPAPSLFLYFSISLFLSLFLFLFISLSLFHALPHYIVQWTNRPTETI